MAAGKNSVRGFYGFANPLIMFSILLLLGCANKVPVRSLEAKPRYAYPAAAESETPFDEKPLTQEHENGDETEDLEQ